jgi:sodium/potassium-transporting ATPase subunit alpha
MDQIKNNLGGKKNKGMGAAVEATEEIRKWEEHMWNLDKLLQKFNTSKDIGLNTK